MNNTSQYPVDRETGKRPKSNRGLGLFGVFAGLLAIALLGLAACSSDQPAADPAAGGGPGGPNGQGGPNRAAFRETPAPELPTTQSELNGPLVRREGASLFVGVNQFGNFRRMTPGATRNPADATPQPYTGPVTEVVTNGSTVLYKDVTQIDFQAAQNGQAIQQKVEKVDSLDALLGDTGQNGTLTVWGDKDGDKVVARTILYRQRQAGLPGGAPPAQ